MCPPANCVTLARNLVLLSVTFLTYRQGWWPLPALLLSGVTRVGFSKRPGHMRRTAAHTGSQITQGCNPRQVKGTEPCESRLEGRKIHKGNTGRDMGWWGWGGGGSRGLPATTMKESINSPGLITPESTDKTEFQMLRVVDS